ncbi:MAG TPA: Rieske (2Fe-2S) protein [Verrucomicrobiae bacterium]
MKAVSRREVIKTFALGAVFSSLGAKSWADSLLFELQQAPAFWEGVLKIDVNAFPALAEPLGSVRIGTFPIGANQKTEAWLKPMMINRGEGDDFYVVSAVCTHEECIVRRLDAGSRAMVCPCHGSAFEIDGQVRNGPAGFPLPSFEFTRQGSVLSISVPQLFYDVTVAQSASKARIELRFVAFFQTVYEVYFRETIDGPAQRVDFAVTEGGPATTSEFTGTINSEYVSLFVDKPGAHGFFQVAVKTGEV